MLYILCSTATRNRGIIFKKLECETVIDLTLAEDEDEAMERLRTASDARYGAKIGRGSWNLDLRVVAVPMMACLMTMALESAKLAAAGKADDSETPPDGGDKETADGEEEQEQVPAGEQEGGVNPQPEA
jgi:hypothetical protein